MPKVRLPQTNPTSKWFKHPINFPHPAGIPEIGVQPFDPLRIESIQVSRGSGGLTLSGGFKKLSIKGPSNTTVRRASLDFEKHALSFDLEIPKLRIDATYNLKGNVLLLPLVGDGDVTMSLKNVKTTVVTKFSVRPLPEVRIRTLLPFCCASLLLLFT